MASFFFGTGGIVIWSLMTAVFVFLATWTWLLVFQLGGIRGTAMATLFTCSAITTAGFALLLSHNAIVSSWVVGAVVTAVWWPILFAAIVLADLYAADRNGHRSFTTRFYLWFKALMDSNRDGDKMTH